MKEREEQSDNKETTECEDTSMKRIEDALSICKFGRFHIRLLFTTFCAVLANMSVTTTSSYILPSAECDLNMTIMEKGVLNAMPFVGQIGAALFTGVLTDAFGRKIFVVSGNLGIFFCAILEGSSQTYWMLVLGKLLDGISLSITWSASAVLLTELTPKNVRDRVNMINGSFMSLSLIIMALTAWAFLPRPWDFVFLEGRFELHSWNIYLYVSSIWGLLAGISYYYLPESPKFLMSQGNEKEALDILRRIYSENSRQPPETFPVTTLNVPGTSVPPAVVSLRKKLTSTLFDVKDLFRGQLLLQLMLFSFTTLVCLLTYTSLRLWFPQLSTIIENYVIDNGGTAQFCTMINDYTQSLSSDANLISNSSSFVENMTSTEVCIPKVSGAETYINSIILGFASLIFVSFTGYLVHFCGQKPLMFVSLILCACCSGVLYWTYTSLQIAILISATCGLMQAALILQQNILIRVIPTGVRTLALSMILMFGRIGSLLGSIIFPVLLNNGCMTPFLSLTCVCLMVAGLVYFLPNPRKDNKMSGDK